MTGQTGKIIADLPKSKALMGKWFGGIAGVLFVGLVAAGFISGLISF